MEESLVHSALGKSQLQKVHTTQFHLYDTLNAISLQIHGCLKENAKEHERTLGGQK